MLNLELIELSILNSVFDIQYSNQTRISNVE